MVNFRQKTFVAIRDKKSTEPMAVGVDVGGPDTVCGTFTWVPNLGVWVRDGTWDADASSIDSVNHYTPITAEEATRLVETLPRLDGRTFGWALRQYEKEPDRLTNEDLGITACLPERRPTSDKALVKAVRDAPLGMWLPVRRFPAGKEAAARKWVSEVRLGVKKRLAPLGPLEAHLETLADGSVDAMVRRSVASGPALVERAELVARQAHGRQKDKAGVAYIDHPRRVAERLAQAGSSPQVVAAGWLHDVLEDTTVTAADLVAEGIPDEVIAAVDAVSHRPGESVEEYADRVLASGIGYQVKLADLADNTDPDRVARLDPATRKRLAAKYDRLRALLNLPSQRELVPASSSGTNTDES